MSETKENNPPLPTNGPQESQPSDLTHNLKRLGVTHAIRKKLDFFDERRWKRFSARRLELIDTLDLSSKKASEQDYEITRVAEALRIEFEYPLDYFDDFDRLVRAAIQSVRRNRKRSSKSKRYPDKFSIKMQKIKDGSFKPVKQDSDASGDYDDLEDQEKSEKFVSEIAKFTSDSQEDHMEYSKTKNITDYDKSRAAIDYMVRPRIGKPKSSGNLEPQLPKYEIPKLPSLEKLNVLSYLGNASAVKARLLNYIERSKSCEEATSKKTLNLEFLGKGVIMGCVGFVFEKSFATANERSLEYLRSKITQESYLADFYRDLDGYSSKDNQLNDEAAVMTLYALLGACIKDFGFETIMIPLCELFYLAIIKEYPLMAQNSVPFRSSDYLSSNNTVLDPEPIKSDSFLQLNSLAAVATDIRQQEQRTLLLPNRSATQSPVTQRSQSLSAHSSTTALTSHHNKKAVCLRFLSSTLNFSFPLNNSATPKLHELLENARSAFHLSTYSENQVLGLRNMKDGYIIKSDLDVENIFLKEDAIELEVFTQNSQAVPISEITSMVIPDHYKDDPHKIILPPPIPVATTRLNQLSSSDPIPLPAKNIKFLSNIDEPSPTPNPPGPPAPILPKFQPLL